MVVNSRREKEGNATVQMAESLGAEIAFVRADLSQPEHIRAMATACVGIYGGLDIAFNNARINASART